MIKKSTKGDALAGGFARALTSETPHHQNGRSPPHLVRASHRGVSPFLAFLFFRLFFCFPLFLFKTSHAARVSDRSFGSQAQIMVMSFKEGDQICGPTHSVGRESFLSCIFPPFFVLLLARRLKLVLYVRECGEYFMCTNVCVAIGGMLSSFRVLQILISFLPFLLVLIFPYHTFSRPH